MHILFIKVQSIFLKSLIYGLASQCIHIHKVEFEEVQGIQPHMTCIIKGAKNFVYATKNIRINNGHALGNSPLKANNDISSTKFGRNLTNELACRKTHWN